MKSNIGKSLALTFLMVAVLVAIFNLGCYYQKLQAPLLPPELPAGVNFSLLWETWERLEQKYPKPLDYQKMIYGAAAGIVDSLEDPYTVFFTPEESEIFKSDVEGKFEGVGMEIGIKEGGLTVVAPLEGTPAERAGLRAGDRILKVDDVNTSDITIDEAVRIIRGPRGTNVSLTIMREGWTDSKVFEVTRDVIKVPSMKWELKEGDIAYIRIYQFSSLINLDFREISLEILDSPAQKIILDLRNNPGGLLSKVQDIASWFLEKGDIVVIEKVGDNGGEKEYKATGNSIFLNYPMVVLINKGSASGAEILAAALRDNRGIELIGETSFGKGSVQEPVGLRGGSTLKVTIAQWLTPNREAISGIGLNPDIEVEITEEDYKKDYDPQLEKAIEKIKGL